MSIFERFPNLIANAGFHASQPRGKGGRWSGGSGGQAISDFIGKQNMTKGLSVELSDTAKPKQGKPLTKNDVYTKSRKELEKHTGLSGKDLDAAIDKSGAYTATVDDFARIGIKKRR